LNDLARRVFQRSFFLQAGYSDERRQALGFAWAVDPALSAALSEDPVALLAARRRHLETFNSNPFSVGLVLGVVGSAERGSVARAAVLKNALSTSLSGPADAAFWGILRPAAAATAVLFAIVGVFSGLRHPLIIGVAVGLTLFNVVAVSVRWLGIVAGLRDGENAAARVARYPAAAKLRSWRRAAAVLCFAAALAGLAYTRAYLDGSMLVALLAFSVGAAAAMRWGT
jgi:mannose/fructose/N-acetylgalactosamine-specific phosphotransferase system component IID